MILLCNPKTLAAKSQKQSCQIGQPLMTDIPGPAPLLAPQGSEDNVLTMFTHRPSRTEKHQSK